MNVSEAVSSRHSVRAFLDKPVDREVIEKLLEQAKWAPSGGNLQPWRVYVVGGECLVELKQLIESKLPAQPRGEGSEYTIYPPKPKDPYRTRRYECGEALYASIDIARDNKAGRLRQYANNFRLFGAPVSLFIAMDRCMNEGQWSDLGMFMQTFMLLAREQGLHTCGLESWAIWPKTVAEFCNIPDEFMLFSGLAIGYKDETAPINNWRTSRASLSEFVEWQGF